MRAMGKGSVSSFLTVLLDVGWYGAVLVMALMACIVAVALVSDVHGGEMDIPASFSVDTRTLRVTAPSLGITDVQIQDARGRALLKFRPPSGAFLAETALVPILFLGFILWVLGQLRAVFRTLRDAQPFVPANATRIRRIAYAVILGEITRSAMVFGGNYYVATHFSAEGLRFDIRPDLDVFAIILGLIILVIAEVFRAGTRLDEEQSLTV
jgi:hypothetical protein